MRKYRPNNVRILGRLSEAELVQQYQLCDAVLVPSRYEGFGYSALEAMACAKPVVCFDLREHRHSAREGALYAEPNRDDDLATQIARLLDDPALCRQLGEYNRQRFLDELAWEHNAGELLSAYEGLCATRRG